MNCTPLINPLLFILHNWNNRGIELNRIMFVNTILHFCVLSVVFNTILHFCVLSVVFNTILHFCVLSIVFNTILQFCVLSVVFNTILNFYVLLVVFNTILQFCVLSGDIFSLFYLLSLSRFWLMGTTLPVRLLHF